MLYFTKMQGLGNDFVCINYEKVKRYNLTILAKYICDRHFGIGADGIILYANSQIADFKMRIFNSDGSEAEMCGNGIRCLAKFLYINGLTHKSKIRIETLNNIKNIEYIIENEKIMAIRVNMGKVEKNIQKMPIYLPNNKKISNAPKVTIQALDKKFEAIFLSVGNPHTIIEVKSLKEIDINKYGKIVENYKYFPRKTNVEFVEVKDKNNIEVRVWERGVGKTLACGTGAVASAYAMYKEGKVKENINVKLEGRNFKNKYKSKHRRNIHGRRCSNSLQRRN